MSIQGQLSSLVDPFSGFSIAARSAIGNAMHLAGQTNAEKLTPVHCVLGVVNLTDELTKEFLTSVEFLG